MSIIKPSRAPAAVRGFTMRGFTMRGFTMRGFTMIEVLVTLVIMMFGLLGIAGLILKGQKAGSEAYQRNQALLLASDMAERMKTNRIYPGGALNPGTMYTTGAATGAPQGAGGAVALTKDCSAVVCSPTDIATYDLQSWNNLLVGTQEQLVTGAVSVGGIVSALGCIETGVAGIPATAVRISVAWQGNNATTPPTSSTCGKGKYGGPPPAAADAYRRVVSIDIL